MNRKGLIIALPLAVAVPVAAFTLGQRPAAVGPSSEQRLTTVTRDGLAQAIDRGASYLRTNRGATYTIRLPAGRFDLSGGDSADENASINVSNIVACPGQLVIAGAGMDRTTLVRDDEVIGIFGRGTGCVTFSDVAFTQHKVEMSQGTVVSADAQQVTLDIPTGFPTPDQLLPRRPEMRNGREVVRRYLRKYVMTPNGPEIVSDQPQVRWIDGQRTSGGANRWTLRLARRANGPTFRRGDLVGIKAKSGGQAYRFLGSDHITFERVRWWLDSRGVFRNTNNVTVENSVIDRPPPINGVPFLLSTSGGGPQVGHPGDQMTSGHLIQNNRFVGTGDDGILLANGTGTVRNNRVTDSFARGIIVVASPNAVIESNVLTRAPLLKTEGGKRAERRRQRRQRAAANDNSSEF